MSDLSKTSGSSPPKSEASQGCQKNPEGDRGQLPKPQGPSEPETRLCAACGETKSITRFYRKGPGRHEGKCIDCRPKRNRGKKPRDQSQRTLAVRVRLKVGSTPTPHLVSTLTGLLQGYLPKQQESAAESLLSVDDLLGRGEARSAECLIEEDGS